MPQPRRALEYANRGCELVSAAAQSLKLAAGLARMGRFVEPLITADQDLVGADDEGSVVAGRYISRFCLGKSKSALYASLPAPLAFPFE